MRRKRNPRPQWLDTYAWRERYDAMLTECAERCVSEMNRYACMGMCPEWILTYRPAVGATWGELRMVAYDPGLSQQTGSGWTWEGSRMPRSTPSTQVREWIKARAGNLPILAADPWAAP